MCQNLLLANDCFIRPFMKIIPFVPITRYSSESHYLPLFISFVAFPIFHIEPGN